MKKLVLLFGLMVVTASAYSQTFSVIHNFGGGVDGGRSWAGLSLFNGTLYGTTRDEGSYCIGGCGIAFQVSRSGSNWSMAPIYFFHASDDGWQPESRLVAGPDGHLYGTTYKGGSQNVGNVYKLTPGSVVTCKSLTCFWQNTPLFSFDRQGLHSPMSDPVWDAQGNIWVTLEAGGAKNDGGVYQLMCSASSCSGTPIYTFSGPDGASPDGGVFIDGNGNVFVIADGGGANGYGAIIELTYQQGVGWSKTYQYDFQGTEGAAPHGRLIPDGFGNLIGAARAGGPTNGGSVFQLSPAGNSWTFKVLYSFDGVAFHSCGPKGTLTLDNGGNLYGAAGCGTHLEGTIFKLTKAGDSWTYTSLHDFNGNDGEAPNDNVVIDADGTLYGTTPTGGTLHHGVIWMIKP